MNFTSAYLDEAAEILAKLDRGAINRLAARLVDQRNQNGRIFFLGVGGSAANASHAVNDFRKICGFEAYAPTDNVAEFSARTNDDGWESVFANWLKGSRLNARDTVFVLSVGGGDLEKNISPNLVRALQYAKEVHATVLGIVGRDGGYTARVADACVVIPTVNANTITPHAEAFQAVIWHLLVSHPALKAAQTKVGSRRGMSAPTFHPRGHRAVFLDRDGVLIKTAVRDGVPHPPASLGEVQILPGVPEALALLREHGWRLIVVTNQPDVARGTQTRAAVEQINQFLLAQLPLDRLYVCYHDTADGCSCRKPAPGMLIQGAAELDVDLARSCMVGDRGSDIAAGAAAGCRTFLIEAPYSRCNPVKPTHKAADLMDVARQIILGM